MCTATRHGDTDVGNERCVTATIDRSDLLCEEAAVLGHGVLRVGRSQRLLDLSVGVLGALVHQLSGHLDDLWGGRGEG